MSPNGSAEYQISYSPLSMTRNDQVPKGPEFHLGTLFFPLPDGSALLYNLKGSALMPDAEEVLEVAMKAKKSQQKAIQVKNWLPEN